MFYEFLSHWCFHTVCILYEKGQVLKMSGRPQKYLEIPRTAPWLVYLLMGMLERFTS